MTAPTQKPLRVFCSYSRRDEEYVNDLRDSLRGLERQGLIEWWHDREISPGWEWEEAIDKHLRTADVILLLVSRAFMASDYVYEKEIRVAVERHELGEARVIPIIIRPADWQWATFGKLQALPKDAKAITRWPDPDDAWLDVVRGVRRAVGELMRERQERDTNFDSVGASTSLQEHDEVPSTTVRTNESSARRVQDELNRITPSMVGRIQLRHTLVEYSISIDNLSCPLQALNGEGQQEADDLQLETSGCHRMDLPGK